MDILAELYARHRHQVDDAGLLAVDGDHRLAAMELRGTAAWIEQRHVEGEALVGFTPDFDAGIIADPTLKHGSAEVDGLVPGEKGDGGEDLEFHWRRNHFATVPVIGRDLIGPSRSDGSLLQSARGAANAVPRRVWMCGCERERARLAGALTGASRDLGSFGFSRA